MTGNYGLSLTLTANLSAANDQPEAETAEIERALAAMCPDWVMSNVRIERFLAGGYSNRNYRLRYNDKRYVLRLPGTNSTTDFVAELGLLNELQTVWTSLTESDQADSVLPLMQLAETVAAIPHQGLLLTRWFERPVLASVAEVSGQQLGEYLAALHKRLASITAKVSSAKPQSLTPLESTAPLIDGIMIDLSVIFSAPSTQQILREHLATVTVDASPAQVCHVDLNPWNLLFDGINSWVTLDWETLNLSPPLFDLVVLCDGYALNQGYSTQQTMLLAQDCLDRYNALMQTHYSRPELTGLRTLFHWREYAWAAARLAQGTLRNAVLGDVRAQRRDYARLLAAQAGRLGVTLLHN